MVCVLAGIGCLKLPRKQPLPKDINSKLTSLCFQSSLSQIATTPGWVQEVESKAPFHYISCKMQQLPSFESTTFELRG